MVSALGVPHLLPILAAASLLGAASPAIAADVSPWDDDLQSAARLIAARAHNESGGRVFRAGVEIKLKEGWKTYWRYPGDSGVPPVLDFSKSQNVKAVTVLYPAPMRFPDGAGGNSIGYKGDVVLPLHVVPEDVGKPVTLNLKLDYAVCEKLCVPVEAKLEHEGSGFAVTKVKGRVGKELKCSAELTFGLAPFPDPSLRVHMDALAGKIGFPLQALAHD